MNKDTNFPQQYNSNEVIYIPSANSSKEALAQPIKSKEKPAQKRIMCFASRTSCIGCFCIAVLLIIVALIVFFTFPRPATATVGLPYFNSRNASNDFVVSGSPSNASTTHPYTITFNMQSNFSVYSPNYFDAKLVSLTLLGTLENTTSQTWYSNVPVAGHADNIDIKKMATTNFTLPLQVNYISTTPFNATTMDPALTFLLYSCSFVKKGSSSSNSSYHNATFGFNVQTITQMLASAGIVPSFNGTAIMPCPTSLTSLKQLFP